MNQCVGAFDRQAVETLRNKPAVVLDGSFEFFALFTHKLTALGIGGSVQHSQSSMTAEDGAMMTLTILDMSGSGQNLFFRSACDSYEASFAGVRATAGRLAWPGSRRTHRDAVGLRW